MPPSLDTQFDIDDYESAGVVQSEPSRAYWRTVFSFPVMLACVIVTTIFVTCNRGIADPDIWWHLRNAEFLANNRAMLHQDLYSFTSAGATWINHEWLGEMPFYVGWTMLGARGLYLVRLCVIEAVILGIFGLAIFASKNIKAAFLASWISIILATVSFGPRTLLFGWLFLVVELAILWAFRQGKDFTWFLPCLFLLWVNTHGSWLIGLVFLAVFVASGLIQGRWGRIEAVCWSKQQRRKLFTVFAISIVALFCNPYTYHLVFYPFDLAFKQKLNISHVEEWKTLDFHTIRGKITFGLIAITILLGLARKRTWQLYEALFLLVALYSAVTYSRFTFLAAIVITPLLAMELDFFPPYKPREDKPVLNGVVIAALIAVIISISSGSSEVLKQGMDEYPVKAIDSLRDFHPDGPVLNYYLWGGYLIWNARQIPVFVDSRVDIFERGGVFGDYLDLIALKQPLEILDKYRIRYVLFAQSHPLTYLLKHSSGWKVKYDDDTTVLFERATTH